MCSWQTGRMAQVAGLILGFAISAAWAAADSAPKLRYGFQAGQQYAYEIKIVADLDDTVESREGVSTYNVLSATDEQAVLKQSGALATRSKPKPGRSTMAGPPRFPGFPGFHGGPRFGMGGPVGLTINRQGEVTLTKPLTHLPFLLGDLETVVLEELPAEARSKWQKERDVSVTERKESRFGRGGPRHFANTSERPAKEKSEYVMVKSAPGTVRIKKTYSLRTAEEGNNPSRFDMKGTGEFTFDLQQGLITALSMKYQVNVNDSNVTLRIPVTLACRLLTTEELAEHQKRQEAARLAAEKANAPKPLEKGEQAKLLADLRSQDRGRAKAAAERLAKAVPEGERGPIAKALAPLLSDPDEWVKGAAAKALAVWVAPEAEAALIQATASENVWVRGPAIEALGKIPSQKGADAVAAQMYRNRHDAARVLKAMGPIAEAATIGCLKDRDGWVRKFACGVLADIGGKASLQVLKEFAPKATWLEQSDANNAIRAIENRLENGSVQATAEAKPTDAGGAASGQPSLRTWRDATGVFEVEGSLVRSQDGKVTLKKRDGREITVPIGKLSAADQDYVAKQTRSP